MTQKPSFSGEVAENYEKYFSPMFFTVPAMDLVARIPMNTETILEIACGTGQVTRLIHEKYPEAKITATDLFPAMIEIARKSFDGNGIEWSAMDAMDITFKDNSFDAVICQFGVMFFPNKLEAFKETFRVLKPGGIYLYNTWDRIEEQHIAEIARDTINSFFTDDPLTFFNVPFSMSDPAEMKELMLGAGFKDVSVENVRLEGHSESIEDAARGFVTGNPIYNAIAERDKGLIPEILKAVEENFKKEFGERNLNIPLSVFVCRGVK